MRVRVDGRLVATKTVTRSRFALVAALPRRDVTIRVSALDARGRHASTIVAPVFGLPRSGLLYTDNGAFVVAVLTWNGRGVGSLSDLLATRVALAALRRP